MKLPESLFVIINPVMRALLRSRAHGLLSDSVMLITFTGRKSGKSFTTPVRYLFDGDKVQCFTTADTQWWRNLRGGADVTLRIRGKERLYRATAIHGEPEKIRAALEKYLAIFPQDAAYQDIRLNKDKTLVAEDLDRAAHHAVVVEATPREGAASGPGSGP